jgi:hypothetical protein
MNYSSYHLDFANDLNHYHNISEQDVLEQPEKYLGPNHKELLNFWFYLDSLSDEQWKVYMDRRNKLGEETQFEARRLAKKLASEVIDPRFVIFLDVIGREIIAAHLFIQYNIPFTVLPLIFDL